MIFWMPMKILIKQVLIAIRSTTKQRKSSLAKQRNLQINQILLGNGSDEVLDLLFRAFAT
jgi:histidinol-phosphate/aromatic aminotransferase/cobyric acid decarboxylase-like protein